MRVLFWGTPVFALPSLRALAEEGHEIVGVVTQPDRPSGRGRKLHPSPIKEVAIEEGWPLLTPERPRGEEFLADIRELRPEVSVVVAYGHILGKEVLDFPEHGSINVHASLLPELRGAAPVNWAIVRGHAVTGVTTMRMVEALDAGPILRQVEEPIGPEETASDLTAHLSEIGAALLIETLALLAADLLEPLEQDDALATYAPKIDREIARIDWHRTATQVGNQIRGMDAVPGAWTELRGDPVKLFSPRPDHEIAHGEEEGRVLTADPDEGLVVATGDGVVHIGEAQPAGKRRMSAHDWIVGRGVAAGDVFE